MGDGRDLLDVVYIVGKGRSGSTLLDDVLGTLPETASTGELWTLWDADWGRQPGYRCACGRAPAECPVWGPALRGVVGQELREDRLAAMDRLQSRVRSWPRVPTLLAGSQPEDARLYARRMGQLYAGVAEATQARRIIDSSKWPAHVGLLGMVPGIRPWLLHLVRDPRAVAHSYTRVKPAEGQPDLPRFGPVHTATSWAARNVAVEAVKRRLPEERQYVLRYEDFVAEPRAVVRSLGEWLGMRDADRAFEGERRVRLADTHLVGGNPRRFERGVVEIRPDDEWRGRADSRRSRVVTGLVSPLLRRYGYSRTVGD